MYDSLSRAVCFVSILLLVCRCVDVLFCCVVLLLMFAYEEPLCCVNTEYIFYNTIRPRNANISSVVMKSQKTLPTEGKRGV